MDEQGALLFVVRTREAMEGDTSDFFVQNDVPHHQTMTAEEEISVFPLDGVVHDETSVLEQTIATMEESQLCFHPVHHHSFTPVSFLISGSMRKCIGCDERLKAVLGMAGDVHDQVVRCISCGAYAHRSCAMETPSRPDDFALMWNTKCPVNTVVMDRMNEGSPTVGEEDEVLVIAEGDMQETQASSPQSLFQFLSPSNLLFAGSRDKNENEHAPKELSVSSDDEEDEEIMLWTSEGPPRHWANEEALSGIHRPNTTDDAEHDVDDEDRVKTPLHIDNNTFAAVSRAIQENIVAHFIRRPFIEKVISQDSTDVGQKVQTDQQTSEHFPQGDVELIIERTRTADSSVSRVEVEALLTQVEPSAPKQNNSIVRVASGTMEAAKASAAMRKKIGVVTVVGGVVGGVAGLCFAGPAGAVIGAKCGQTAGLLGVLLEGSMTVGVFVAGVAAGSFTATHIQEQQQKRVLTIGEDGVKQKLLLVRPNVWIDPEWEEICEKARSNHSSNHRSFSLLPSSQGKKERLKRDSDIVETDESEIATAEKVFLLVSRSLNDKESLPGHVYKRLIEVCREREKVPCVQLEDKREGDASAENVETPNETETEEAASFAGKNKANGEKEPLVENADKSKDSGQDERQKTASAMRARRQDTHAVIKHVTATLLEVRPGFASSPAVTEMSATAVEALVFGEVYDSVFEEIAEETHDCDSALMEKIRVFDQEHEFVPEGGSKKAESGYSNGLISQPAVDALLLLTEAHSVADKLRYCVEFLELISVHFTENAKNRLDGKVSSLSADSLLKMVCQHIIAAKVPNINAEILFLEEFARDEQLLRGKEGYALVTLQAALHFLNTSTSFDEDIFGQD